MACPDRNSPRRIDDLNRTHEIIVIRQRLAHSHEDNVVNAFSALFFDRHDLIHNFIGAQIAFPSVEPARAEFAAVGATDLGRKANCPPIRW